MNIIQAVKYMMRVLIPQITPIAGEGIEVAKEKEGSVISATFPGWLPHGEVYVGNSTNAAWAAGTVVALGASAVADPLEDTLAASIPAVGADGQFAVLSSDAPAGWEALAAVTGLAVARMSAGWMEAFAVPDGLGGLAGAASGPFRVIYASQSAGEALVAFAGGGGAAPAPVADNTPDIFKAKNNTTTSKIDVSGGTCINGNSSFVCNSASFNYPANNASYYVVLTVTYSNGYTATLGTSSTAVYPVAQSATYTLMLALVENVGGEIKISNMRYPSPVYVVGRWG